MTSEVREKLERANRFIKNGAMRLAAQSIKDAERACCDINLRGRIQFIGFLLSGTSSSSFLRARGKLAKILREVNL